MSDKVLSQFKQEETKEEVKETETATVGTDET